MAVETYRPSTAQFNSLHGVHHTISHLPTNNQIFSTYKSERRVARILLTNIITFPHPDRQAAIRQNYHLVGTLVKPRKREIKF